MMLSRRELTATPDGTLVSGDDLAASFEKYLAEMDDKNQDEL